MLTLEEFAKKHDLRLISTYVDRRPDGLMQDVPGALHYGCSLHGPTPTYMAFHFSKGPGLSGPPTLEEALSCLWSQCRGYENVASFEEWCNELGFDSDSRKAKRTYKAVERQYHELANTLGYAAFDEFMNEVEPD